MKNAFLIACLFVLSATISFAQPHIDTEGGGSGGIDITSVLIGAAVGLVIGYLVGARMAKK